MDNAGMAAYVFSQFDAFIADFGLLLAIPISVVVVGLVVTVVVEAVRGRG